MAKKKGKAEGPFCKAIVSDGVLRMEYLHPGSKVVGRDSYDEDVSEWTDEEIRKLVRNYLDMKEGEEIQVIHD